MCCQWPCPKPSTPKAMMPPPQASSSDVRSEQAGGSLAHLGTPTLANSTPVHLQKQGLSFLTGHVPGHLWSPSIALCGVPSRKFYLDVICCKQHCLVKLSAEQTTATPCPRGPALVPRKLWAHRIPWQSLAPASSQASGQGRVCPSCSTCVPPHVPAVSRPLQTASLMIYGGYMLAELPPEASHAAVATAYGSVGLIHRPLPVPLELSQASVCAAVSLVKPGIG